MQSPAAVPSGADSSSASSIIMMTEATDLWAVDIREPRPFHRTAEDGELLPKSDILES